ncbi:MAG: peptidoglycan editing factor PgeF [Rhodocyclaceae bacterium]|nr:peptidoglycan editing factor PgeF [Rhodocyclaceae bacterium]
MPDIAPAPAGDPPVAKPTLEERYLIVPDWPAPPNVGALATTRGGGCSAAPYDSLNLGTHVGDDDGAVAANRRLLRERLSAAPRWLSQVHGLHCVDVAAVDDGVEADAGFSRTSRHACAVLTADCLPVLLCDEAGTVVAAAHAGWRGLASGVIEATVAAMRVPAPRLMAWLGPAIGPGAFEVGDEVRAAFLAADAATAAAFVPHGPGKWLCDLYALARRRLARLGVERVSGGGFCTHADSGRFFSYRRDGVTGRMATLVWLASD